VTFGGTPNAISGTFRVAAISFRVKAGAAGTRLNLTGTVNTLATAGQVQIGGAAPRAIVAGSVAVVVTGRPAARRARDSGSAAAAAAAGSAHGSLRIAALRHMQWRGARDGRCKRRLRV
jgi:hypothetical protein